MPELTLVVLDDAGQPHLVLSPAETPPAGEGSSVGSPDTIGAFRIDEHRITADLTPVRHDAGPAYDALVAGGGPAGAICAIGLARHGRRVLLLDAQEFPRYQVGESLSPAACEVLESAGISLAGCGFTRKPGATFVWGDRPPFSTYYGSSGAWHVRRTDLDAQLLRQAAAAGATVRTGCRLEKVVYAGDRAIGGQYIDADGSTHEVSASWLIDATGADSLLASQSDLVEADPLLAWRASWAYWRGARRPPGRAAENSLYVGAEGECLWYLPVADRDNVVDVGVLTPLTSASEEAYEAVLRRSGLMADLLRDAVQVEPVRTAAPRAWSARHVTGPGWLLAGDAAGFVDPILTPGVQLALRQGQLAAATVNAALDQPGQAAAALEAYERSHRRQHATFRRLAMNLYAAAGDGKRELNTNDVVGGDERADRLTFLGVIAGRPAPQVAGLLGDYLGMRGAAVGYGAPPPVFGESEGFSFLSWFVGRGDRPDVPAPPPESLLGLAPEVTLEDLVFAPAAGTDMVQTRRAASNRFGDRFLPTPEIETLLGVLDCPRALTEAARLFFTAFKAEIDVDDFACWIRLLARHGLVQWQQQPVARPTRTESREL